MQGSPMHPDHRFRRVSTRYGCRFACTLIAPDWSAAGSKTAAVDAFAQAAGSRCCARTNSAQGVGLVPRRDLELVTVLEVHPAPGVGVEVPRQT